MVHGVDNVELALGVARQPGGPSEFAGARAGCAPAEQELALPVEDGDAVERLVADVQPLVRVRRDRDRPAERTFGVAQRAEGVAGLLVVH